MLEHAAEGISKETLEHSGDKQRLRKQEALTHLGDRYL